MSDLVRKIKDNPITSILVIGGVIFLVLIVTGTGVPFVVDIPN